VNYLRMISVVILLLLPASHAWADGFYSAFVCNDGQIAVDAATAVLYHRGWEVAGWTRIAPARCEKVYAGDHENSSLWGASEIHIAFAFTDSTGV
jgi:uncharacterized membrane protein